MDISKIRKELKTTKNDREFSISALVCGAAAIYELGIDRETFAAELRQIVSECGKGDSLVELCREVLEVLGRN